MAAGLGRGLMPAVQNVLTTYAGRRLPISAVLRARGVGGWRQRRGMDAGCAGTRIREGMGTEATMRPDSARVESARGVGGVASIYDDLATTTVSVPARTVSVPSLGIVWR